mmetsp:Transcript_24528/g.27282  ORF Transcript_24528/g.27282 Transcript_24528/m.27282 type:complete len:249 (-) Transcript_24528:110-856(-)
MFKDNKKQKKIQNQENNERLVKIFCSPELAQKASAQIFTKLDKDRSGTLTVSEIFAGARSLGVEVERGTLGELVEVFSRGGTTVNRAQFMQLLKYLVNLRSTYLTYDKDGSNSIDKRELDKCLKDLEYKFSASTQKKFMSFFDKDSSGQFEFIEFVNIMWHLKKLSHHFQKQDKDDNKLLDPPEFQALLRGLGFSVTVAEAKVFMRRHAKKGLSLENFIDLMFDFKNHYESIKKGTHHCLYKTPVLYN